MKIMQLYKVNIRCKNDDVINKKNAYYMWTCSLLGDNDRN